MKISNYSLILGYLSAVLMLVGFFTLIPLIALAFYPHEIIYAKCFIIPGITAILVGYIGVFYMRGKKKGHLAKHQDTIVVVAAWMLAIIVSSMPFILTGDYNFTQAMFEATSGFSTTGLTVVDVEKAPNILLIFRSTTLFFGGVGLVLVMMTVLSDSYGMRLYQAEGHSDRLLPNLFKSARLVMTIYAGYILGGIILFMLFGMSAFDAINHAIAAVSTGGFGTHGSNIGYFDSPAIEITSMVLMLLGSTNFLVSMLLLKGKFKAFFSHCEVKFSLLLLATFFPIMLVLIIRSQSMGIEEGVRAAIFQMVSALTTTGFQTVPGFNTWNSALMLLMIILMLVGGGAGSTAGGIKQFRIYVALKEMWWTLKRKLVHNRVVQINQIRRFGKWEPVNDRFKAEANAYITFYLILLLLGTFIYTAFGYPLDQAMFEFASALGTVGISAGITTFNAHPVILWTATIGMFVGRLEIYIIFLAVMRIWGDGKAKVLGK